MQTRYIAPQLALYLEKKIDLTKINVQAFQMHILSKKSGGQRKY